MMLGAVVTMEDCFYDWLNYLENKFMKTKYQNIRTENLEWSFLYNTNIGNSKKGG